MPKQLINTVGVLIVVAILAIGIALVAVPLYLQSVSTQAQADQVAAANAAQAASVDELRAQESNDAELDAELDELRAQIPATPRVYTISQLVSEAAADTGVALTGITPNAPVAFDPANEVDTGIGSPTAEPVTGRAEIPVQITVLAASDAEIIAFLDRLREGPRLLGDIEATISSRGGADASIKAVAFADIEEADITEADAEEAGTAEGEEG